LKRIPREVPRAYAHPEELLGSESARHGIDSSVAGRAAIENPLYDANRKIAVVVENEDFRRFHPEELTHRPERRSGFVHKNERFRKDEILGSCVLKEFRAVNLGVGRAGGVPQKINRERSGVMVCVSVLARRISESDDKFDAGIETILSF